MRDAIEFEWAGIPSVAIIAEPLVGSAEAMKRVSGVMDYDYIVVPYPVGSLTREQVQARAREITPKIIQLLTSKR
jgi:hypothetical protein